MSGYIEAGYVVALGSTGLYTAVLLRREQLARRRIEGARSSLRRNGAVGHGDLLSQADASTKTAKQRVELTATGSAPPAATDGTTMSVPALKGQHSSRTRRRLALIGVVLAAAAGLLLYKGLTAAFVYFKTAQQAVADRATLGNSNFQIEGIVVPGSEKTTGPSSVRFAISSGPVTVHVENQGTPPQLFGSNVPVVLVGHFVGTSNIFSSDQILVKHSNEYIAAHRSRVTAPNGSVH